MSEAMGEKDLRPNRYHVTLNLTIAFIREYFEQNPISQLAILGMRNGVAEPISGDLSGNPDQHIRAISKQKDEEPAGQPSLENALTFARAALFHAPSHGTREILLVMGALNSVDAGDLHATIDSLVVDKIHASVIGLAAHMAICNELVKKTNNGDPSGYKIILHEPHLRELLLAVTTPPATNETNNSSLLMMGFPSRVVDKHASLCACHSRPGREGYLCTQCGTKVCGLPAECPACSLTLILSTHLARSYHHLFPLVNWIEVPWSKAKSVECFGCQKPFPAIPNKTARYAKDGRETGSARYECTVCGGHFCVECDLFAVSLNKGMLASTSGPTYSCVPTQDHPANTYQHEIIHNCPSCQSGNATAGLMGETEQRNGTTNGAR